LAAPFDYPARSISITASIGIAVSRTPELDPQALVGDADSAMYRAKGNGRARYEFSDRRPRDERFRRGA
jgi:PleD family two-component response regulator